MTIAVKVSVRMGELYQVVLHHRACYADVYGAIYVVGAFRVRLGVRFLVGRVEVRTGDADRALRVEDLRCAVFVNVEG